MNTPKHWGFPSLFLILQANVRIDEERRENVRKTGEDNISKANREKEGEAGRRKEEKTVRWQLEGEPGICLKEQKREVKPDADEGPSSTLIFVRPADI